MAYIKSKKRRFVRSFVIENRGSKRACPDKILVSTAKVSQNANFAVKQWVKINYFDRHLLKNKRLLNGRSF